jgi:hypothetical protein
MCQLRPSFLYSPTAFCFALALLRRDIHCILLARLTACSVVLLLTWTASPSLSASNAERRSLVTNTHNPPLLTGRSKDNPCRCKIVGPTIGFVVTVGMAVCPKRYIHRVAQRTNHIDPLRSFAGPHPSYVAAARRTWGKRQSHPSLYMAR